jgi:hypothetical protein
MPGNPYYVTYSSSGPGQWWTVDTGTTPPYFIWTWSIVSTSAGSTANGDLKLEWTADNPIAYGSSKAGTGAGLAVAPSSQAPLATTLTAMSSAQSGAYALNSYPIYAWRINQQSSGFTVNVTFLQAGKKQ